MKILYFRPRDDDDPPPRPSRRRHRQGDAAAEADRNRRPLVLDAFAGSRSLPQAA